MNNTPAQTVLQVQSMTNVDGLLHIELPGGLMLTGPCLVAPLPPEMLAQRLRLRADAVPDHFWMMNSDEGSQQNAGA